MEVTVLIQSINESLGEIRIFQGQTVSKIEDIAKDVSEVVQRHNDLCLRVSTLEEYVQTQKIGMKTTMLIIGAISGLMGAMGGALSIILVLYQIGTVNGAIP